MFMRTKLFACAVLLAAMGSSYAQSIEDGANCTEIMDSMRNAPGNAAIKRAEEIATYGSRIVRMLDRYYALTGERALINEINDDRGPANSATSGVLNRMAVHCSAHPKETILDAALGVYANARLFQDTFGKQ